MCRVQGVNGVGVIGQIGRLTRMERVRRNHALEHAAISIVTARHPNLFLTGRSNSRGFYVMGEIDTEELRSAIGEARERLQRGEADLAIHPRCGTNLAVAGILSGLAAAVAAQPGLTRAVPGEQRINRFTYAILASLGALLVSPILGTAAQRHVTTLADLGDLEVESIRRRRFLRQPAHFVRTTST